MPATTERASFIEEIADFIATRPSTEQILEFRPSPETQQRVRELLAKNRQAKLSEQEQDELEQFEQGELFMQLVKARVRPAEKKAS